MKPDGIICGHDYIPKFPDVMIQALCLAENRKTDLLVVASFWCVLPKVEDVTRARELQRCRQSLSQLPDFRAIPFKDLAREKAIVSRRQAVQRITSFAAAYTVESPHNMERYSWYDAILCRGRVTNESGSDWPIYIDGQRCLRVGITLISPAGEKVGGGRAELSGTVFKAGETKSFLGVASLAQQVAPGPCLLEVDLLYDNVCWFSRREGRAAQLDLELQ